MDPVHCVVTGALGTVGYYLSFLVASGAFLGGNKKVILSLVEAPGMKEALAGLRMEIEDYGFESIAEIRTGTDPYEMFQEADCVFLVGARPRGLGMERKDLLLANGAIFQEQGKALDKAAKKDARILVVGNPCNTNCLIALHNAPSLSPFQFSALTGLDEVRARVLLAKQANACVSDVSSVTIWGNHSPTLVPDITHTCILGTNAKEFLDGAWIETEFPLNVRQRGSQIIKTRGKSSAASAANAALQTMNVLMGEKEQQISLAVYAQNNPYGIDPDLVFSFPCLASRKGYNIAPSRQPEEILWKQVLLSEKELIEERDAIKHLL